MHRESSELNVALLLLLSKQTKDLKNCLLPDNVYITLWDDDFILLVINYTIFFTSGFTRRKLI